MATGKCYWMIEHWIGFDVIAGRTRTAIMIQKDRVSLNDKKGTSGSTHQVKRRDNCCNNSFRHLSCSSFNLIELSMFSRMVGSTVNLPLEFAAAV